MNLGEEVKIYVKFDGKQPTSNKPYNRDLIRYLKGNIDTLNGCGNFIDLLLVDENDIEHLKKVQKQQGVEELPVLICIRRPMKVYGTPKIKDFLKRLCRNRPQHLKPKNPDEEVMDFQRALMGCDMHMAGKPLPDDNDENLDDAHIEDMARATSETQKRKDRFEMYSKMSSKERLEMRQEKRYRMNPGNRTYPGNEPEEGFSGGDRNVKLADNPAAIQRMMGSKDMSDQKDNDLMAQFWENNTETKM